jgi:hypothetical protein
MATLSERLQLAMMKLKTESISRNTYDSRGLLKKTITRAAA